MTGVKFAPSILPAVLLSLPFFIDQNELTINITRKKMTLPAVALLRLEISVGYNSFKSLTFQAEFLSFFACAWVDSWLRESQKESTLGNIAKKSTQVSYLLAQMEEHKRLC